MPPARRRALTIAWAVAAACLLPGVAHDTLGVWIGSDLPRDVTFCAVFLLAAGLCLARAALVPAERAAWLAIGGGVCLYAGGWIVDLFVYGGAATMPSAADALWLGAYLGFYPGVVLLGRERFARRGLGMWLDGLLGALALAAATASTALHGSLTHLDAGGGAAAIGAAYPVADVALLTFLATMYASSTWRPSRSGSALLAGLLVLAGVDTLFAVDSASAGWSAGTSYDPLWGSAMLLVAASAWLPARRATLQRDTRRALLFPSAFAAIAVAVLVYGQTTHLSLAPVVLAVLALVTVMVRMALLLK